MAEVAGGGFPSGCGVAVDDADLGRAHQQGEPALLGVQGLLDQQPLLIGGARLLRLQGLMKTLEHIVQRRAKVALIHPRLDFIHRLQAELAVIQGSIDDVLRDSGDGAGDDQADSGSKAFEREQEMTLLANARERIGRAILANTAAQPMNQRSLSD